MGDCIIDNTLVYGELLDFGGGVFWDFWEGQEYGVFEG